MNLSKKTTALSLLLTLITSSALHANQLEFKSTVEPICGISIHNNDAQGEINFAGEKNAQTAKFVVSSNSINGAAKVKFGSIRATQNIAHKNGYFKINHGDKKAWTNDFEVDVKNGETQEVSAHIPSAKKDITAGQARVTTTITVACQ